MKLIIDKEVKENMIEIGDVVVFDNGVWGVIFRYNIGGTSKFFVADICNGYGGFVGEFDSIGGLIDKLEREGDNKIYSAKEFELMLKKKTIIAKEE